MTTPNTSTGPPTLSNPRGTAVSEAAGCTLGLVAIVVCLRLWGRFRYTSGPREAFRLQFGDHRFWVLLSDLTILLSFIMAIVLTVLACLGVYWGFGLHQKVLSPKQTQNALEMFYLYQIFYKFAAGISKIATCFLLLAISSKQMARFNLVCHVLIIYIAGYCVACSIATVFQCDLDFSSNWIHSKTQVHCFPKPPFWYSHAGLNILASVIIAALPWWLFHYITYKRKYVIATLMTMLSVSEIVFGSVRLKGLYISSHSLTDLTFGATTGVLVSQLEVNFGIMAACVPTVLKITEDFVSRLFRLISGRELQTRTQTQSHSLKSDVQLSSLDKSIPRKTYTRFGEEEEDLGSTHSGNSRVNIITKDQDQIKVETSFLVESNTTTEVEKNWVQGVQAKSSAHVRTGSRH